MNNNPELGATADAAAQAHAQAPAGQVNANMEPMQPVQLNIQATTIEERLAQMQARLDVYENRAVQSTINLRLESPDTFSAKKHENVDRWLFQVEQYLRVSNQASDPIRVAYASALLRGDAQKWWENKVTAAATVGLDESQCTWVEFKTMISQQFQVVNKELKARDALASLVQKGSVSDYVSKFTTLAFDVPDLSLAEKHDRFFRGLKYKVRMEIMLKGIPDNYDELVKLAERIDTILFEMNSGNRNNGNGKGWKQKNNYSAANVDSNANGPTPMDIGSVDHPPKLTKEEKERCIREGRCFACRQKDHLASNCPKYPKKDIPNGKGQ